MLVARRMVDVRDDEPDPVAEARGDGDELFDLAGGQPVDAVGARLRRRRSGRAQATPIRSRPTTLPQAARRTAELS